MKTVALALFAILLLSHITAADKIQHQCVHDEKFKGYKRQLVEEHTDESWRRIMQGIPTSGSGSVSGGFSTGGSANVADGWHQLRISMDYRQSNTFVQSSSSLSSVYQLSIRQIETVRTYFMKFFQVNFSANLRFGGGTCYKNNIPAFDIPADLFITVFAENNRATSYFAAATTCASTTRDGRPVIGAYILNLAFLKATPINEYLYFSTFAHEFTHILGFSDDLFPDFVVPGTNKKRGLNAVMGTTNIGGNTFATIVLPEVVNYAKSYFGCPSITGIPLENNGGSGSASSHWEKTFLPQEYMNPTVENPGIISDFTLNLLRGSGWYKIDTAAVQHYDWAQNSGCGHFSICPVGPGYCKGSQVSVDICSSEYNAKAYCDESRTFGSACPVKRSESHSCLLASYTPVLQNEYYGPGSRCINYVSAAGPEASKCHRVNCNNGQLSITVGANTVTCTTTGQKISVGTTSIECPDLRDFCDEFSYRCPNDCNTNGVCLIGNTCHCYTGFTGSDCSTKTNIDYNSITKGFSWADSLTLGVSLLVSMMGLFC